MDDAGDIEYRYEFKYNGKDMWVREIGLDFELPLDAIACWTATPSSAIIRPTTWAVRWAKPSRIRRCRRPFRRRPALRPGRSQLGCNDFRGVKPALAVSPNVESPLEACAAVSGRARRDLSRYPRPPGAWVGGIPDG